MASPRIRRAAGLAYAFGVQVCPALFPPDVQGQTLWSHSGPLTAYSELVLSPRIAKLLTASAKPARRQRP